MQSKLSAAVRTGYRELSAAVWTAAESLLCIIVTVEPHNVGDPVSSWVISIKSMEGPPARAEIDVRCCRSYTPSTRFRVINSKKHFNHSYMLLFESRRHSEPQYQRGGGSVIGKTLRRYCHRRFWICRLAAGNDCAPAGTFGDFVGEIQAPAFCHRRIIHASGKSAIGGAGDSLQPAPSSTLDQVGKLATVLSRNRLRLETRVHLLF